MTDNADVYLGRCLKNWVEREKSHARSKESLLRLAAAQARTDDSPTALSHGMIDEYRYRGQAVHYPGFYLRGSFSSSSLGWSVDLSTLLRMAQ